MIIEGKYKEKDVSTIILMVLEQVVSLIALREGLTFEESYHKFINSKSYNRLKKPSTLMWAESAEYILDDFYA